MFTLPDDHNDRIIQALARRVCTTPDGEAYILRGYGRRKAGRPACYVVCLGKGYHFRLTAHSDEEAVEKANLKAQSKIAKEKSSC